MPEIYGSPEVASSRLWVICDTFLRQAAASGNIQVNWPYDGSNNPAVQQFATSDDRLQINKVDDELSVALWDKDRDVYDLVEWDEDIRILPKITRETLDRAHKGVDTLPIRDLPKIAQNIGAYIESLGQAA
jgi:hypothetical protein